MAPQPKQKDESWHEFRQTEALTTRIHNILREYPPGVGTIKEFLQNADDAGARRFSLFLDTRPLPQTQLLTPALAGWQGPALYLYNSATFSDADFDNITQVGHSGKAQDVRTIGKYGLGFNCAYHFTDLVQFVSRDQLILFDPHGRVLPRGVLGLRTDFPSHCHSDSPFVDIMAGFQLELYGTQDMPHKEVEGTLFRLPLRSPPQAEESLLSGSSYSPPELEALLQRFIQEASEMILFLSHVEEVQVHVRRQPEGPIECLGAVHMADLSEEVRRLRAQRNLPPEEGQRRRKGAYSLTLVSHIGEATQRQRYLLTSLSRPRQLSESEQRIDPTATVQWVNVAACWEGQCITNGAVYCALPLPMRTGYPVHINGNFALSSNRRHLWEEAPQGDGGPAAFKSAWNQELCGHLLVEAYLALLKRLPAHLAQPEALYQYWPCASQGSGAGYLQAHFEPHFLHALLTNQPKLFWSHHTHQWLPASQVLFPDPALPSDDSLYAALHALRLETVFLPPFLVEWLRRAEGEALPVLSGPYLMRVLRDMNPNAIKGVRGVADQLLLYLLRGTQDMKLPALQQHVNQLDGLPILPLLGGRVGTFHSASRLQAMAGHASDHLYLLCTREEHMQVLPDCPRFLDPRAESVEKLRARTLQGQCNVRLFHPTILPAFMGYIVPPAWRRASSVFVSGRLLHEKVLDLAESAGPKGAKGGQGGRKGPKGGKKKKISIEGLITAKDTRVALPDLTARLHRLWRFIQESDEQLGSFKASLTGWPVVLLDSPDGHMVSTLESCRTHGALYYKEVQQYGGDATQVLKQYGCTFFHEEAPILRTLMGAHTKSQSLQSIVRYLTQHRQLEVLKKDSQTLRRVLLDWIRASQDHTISGDHIESLPLFLNLAGDESLRISSRLVIHPPHEWLPICQRHFAAVTIDTEEEDNRMLLQRVTRPAPPLKEFLATHLVPHLHRLPQEVCMEFLRAVGRMRDADSPWTAARNRDNRALLEALETQPLIVYADGHRCRIGEIMDASDESSALLPWDDSTPYAFAPPAYQNDPLIARVIKRMPVRSLSTYAVFQQAAENAAREHNITAGSGLVRFLGRAHGQLKWSSPQMKALSQIAFVPCYDWRQAPVGVGVEPVPTECTHLCSFREGVPWEEAAQAWTQSVLFTPLVSSLPVAFTNRLGMAPHLPPLQLVPHLFQVRDRMATPDEWIPAPYQEAYRRLSETVCKRMNQTLKKHSSSTAQEVKLQLSQSAFIMLDTGELVYPHQLCFDLDEDLGAGAKAVPAYLRPYQKLFSSLGTPMVLAEPKVREHGEAPRLHDFLLQCRDNAQFADIHFTHAPSGGSFYAHRLVVCHSCPYLHKMFTSGMREATSSALHEYALPEWMAWEAFLMVMDYCYAGDPTHSRPLDTHKEEDVALLTEVLRIADCWLLSHLLCWCEVRLSQVRIDVFNVCVLYDIADACQASQLLEYCAYTIRVMFSAVKETDEWAQLSSSQKERILAGTSLS